MTSRRTPAKSVAIDTVPLPEKFAKPSTLSRKDLQSIINVARRRGVRVIDWEQYGQPAIDAVAGKYQVSASAANAVLRDLLRLDMRLHLDVFPNGVPVVDHYTIGFETGRVRR